MRPSPRSALPLSRVLVIGLLSLGALTGSAATAANPALAFATYLGGADWDSANDVAVDSQGYIYVVGGTASTNFPATPGAYQAINHGPLGKLGGGDAFVVKLDPTGQHIVWATFLGGTADDSAWAVGVDSAGRVYVAGVTASDDFPTLQPLQAVPHGKTDLFLACLSPDGSNVLFSTYLGGAQADQPLALALDGTGNLYVTGYTSSPDFPTTAGAFQAALAGSQDAFVLKLGAAGTNLVYATFLGGSRNTAAYGIAVDATGQAYVAGGTDSTDYPVTAGAFQPFAKSLGDAIVTKLDPAGAQLVYSTYLGGFDAKAYPWDVALGIAVDSTGCAYVTGYTLSRDFPTTPGAYDTLCGSEGNCNPQDQNGIQVENPDAFLVKLNPTGCALVFGTYLGGKNGDEGRDVAIDAAGRIHVAGVTSAADFPVTADSFQPAKAGKQEVFIARFDATGRALQYATYYGGTGDDSCRQVALAGDGSAIVVGDTASLDLAGTGSAVQPANGGGTDALALRITFPPAPDPFLVLDLAGAPRQLVIGAALTNLLSIVNGGTAEATNVACTVSFGDQRLVTSTAASQGTAVFSNGTVRCALGTLPGAGAATVEIISLATTNATLHTTAEASAANAPVVTANSCAEVNLHDFAVLAIKAKKSLKLEPGQAGATTVTVEIQNRSDHAEAIPNLVTLAELLKLTVLPLGTNCPPAVAGISTAKPPKLPVTLQSGATFKVTFDVAFNCVVDPAKSSKDAPHADYRYVATVDYAVLDGIPDGHPVDDTCPRPPLPGGIDPYPDGHIKDKGCGSKQADGTLGGDVLTDLVVK